MSSTSSFGRLALFRLTLTTTVASRLISKSKLMLYILFFVPFSSLLFRFFTTIDEFVDVVLLVRDWTDGFDGRTCVDGLLVRDFFDGEAESSLDVSSLRTDFALGDIFSVLPLDFDAATAFADGRPTFGRCSFNGLTFFAEFADDVDATADDDDTLNSNSPLFVLPSAFSPSEKNLRHFS